MLTPQSPATMPVLPGPADLLDLAARFHASGYPTIAGCLARAGTELFVRSLCRLHNCTPTVASGPGMIPMATRCTRWLERRGIVDHKTKNRINRVLNYCSRATHGRETSDATIGTRLESARKIIAKIEGGAA